MDNENPGSAEPTREELEQGVIDQYIESNNLNEGLPPEDRDLALSLVKRLMATRHEGRYDRKYQRQFELQSIRSDVWLLRNHSNTEHAGFLRLLDSVESGIELDFDSMKKGYIER